MLTADGKQQLKSNILLIVTVLLTAAVLLGTVFMCNFVSDKKTDPCDKGNAHFDLSSVAFSEDGGVYLTGEWEFYHSAFLKSDNLTADPVREMIEVPSSWSGVLDTRKYSAGGYASYRCYITNVNSDSYLAIYIPNIACAYKIYVGGELVSISGTPSKTYNETVTSAGHYSLPFKLSSGEEYEVVVEISADHFSGIYLPVYLTEYTNDNYTLSSKIALRFVLCGIVFLCGLMFVIFRKFVSREQYTPWLPFLAFFLLLRMLITTESYSVIQPYMFNIGYEEMNVFIFISTFIIKLVALIYIIKSLDIKVHDNTLVAMCATILGLAISINFLPNSIFDTYYYLSLQMLSLVIDFYTTNKLCIEIVKKTPYAFLYLFSYLFIVFGLTVDVAYTNGLIKINCSSVMPVCFFAFALITLIIQALRIRQFYNYALKARILEAELERANTAVMISQIQPHFLYNALNTIKSLIKRDPKKAEKAVIDFSLYLRGNMDSLTQKDPIPFSEELEHVKYYCNIEKLRFRDKLDIYYEIETDSFYVPTLSVQPIVENAIKHGVTKKSEGGTVTVSTYEDEKNFYVKVEDDGKGFDVSSLEAERNDGRSHIGIANIKKRFADIMGGIVSIESKEGVGTTVTVTLPKDKNVKTLKESLELQNRKDIFGEMNI